MSDYVFREPHTTFAAVLHTKSMTTNRIAHVNKNLSFGQVFETIRSAKVVWGARASKFPSSGYHQLLPVISVTHACSELSLSLGNRGWVAKNL